MPKTIIAYIPALHQGYLNFFTENPGQLLVLGPSFIKQYPKLDRDIRALEPAVVAQAITALGIMDSVKVLDDRLMLKDIIDQEIILPDDEVSRQFANDHLAETKFQLVPAFLRWSRLITTTEYETKPDRLISQNKFDQEMIKLAEAQTKLSPDWWRQVGAVLVKDGQPLLVGHNRPLLGGDYTFGAFGDPRSNFDAGVNIELSKALHAEAGIIAEAAKRGIGTAGAAMYVTTFPCPVCAKSVAAAGIKTVYYHSGYSLLDAEDILKANQVELIKVGT